MEFRIILLQTLFFAQCTLNVFLYRFHIEIWRYYLQLIGHGPGSIEMTCRRRHSPPMHQDYYPIASSIPLSQQGLTHLLGGVQKVAQDRLPGEEDDAFIGLDIQAGEGFLHPENRVIVVAIIIGLTTHLETVTYCHLSTIWGWNHRSWRENNRFRGVCACVCAVPVLDAVQYSPRHAFRLQIVGVLDTCDGLGCSLQVFFGRKLNNFPKIIAFQKVLFIRKHGKRERFVINAIEGFACSHLIQTYP